LIKNIDITNSEMASRVLNIQIPAYLVEAEIIHFHELPPLKDTIETLQFCGETFYGYYMEEELCGVISFRNEEDVMDIHRLFVHPKHFRNGIAKKLLEYVESLGCQAMIVSTGSKNTPAVNFYLNQGFEKIGEMEVVKGLFITQFKKEVKQ